MLNKEDYPNLSESEFKLLANINAYKANKNIGGIVKLPYNGDGFKSYNERHKGYHRLKDLGYIFFDVKKSSLNHADVELLK